MMNRRRLASLLACGLLVLPARGQAGDAEQGRALAQVLEMNGTVRRDETKPGTPVVGVDLSGTQISDAGLAHLKGLTTLETLYLSGTRVSDAGLAHLKGLTTLKTLHLFRTRVSDAGVTEFHRVMPKVKMLR
jgi:Leucine Rich repeat